MGPDLKSKRLIVFKGGLFLLLAILSGAPLVFLEYTPPLRALFLGLCLWAACRFYYFLFYVLHTYVDPSLPQAGILALLKSLTSRK